mmetsp:Transcript_32067/g.68932  ORF Transcript_32067/g.68932 Transcript_32067/m.68932 type:complete len:217 (-) Transcript_32067:164-814(-)
MASTRLPRMEVLQIASGGGATLSMPTPRFASAGTPFVLTRCGSASWAPTARRSRRTRRPSTSSASRSPSCTRQIRGSPPWRSRRRASRRRRHKRSCSRSSPLGTRPSRPSPRSRRRSRPRRRGTRASSPPLVPRMLAEESRARSCSACASGAGTWRAAAILVDRATQKGAPLRASREGFRSYGSRPSSCRRRWSALRKSCAQSGTRRPSCARASRR